MRALRQACVLLHLRVVAPAQKQRAVRRSSRHGFLQVPFSTVALAERTHQACFFCMFDGKQLQNLALWRFYM